MIDVAIGPVFTNSGFGKKQERKFLFESPDNEQIRATLVNLLNKMSVNFEIHQFSDLIFNEELIKQLTIFKEQRAIEGLLKLINIDIESITNLKIQNRAILLIGLSIEAVMLISDGEQLHNIERFISKGIEDHPKQEYLQKYDRLAIIRYFAINGLRHLNSNKAIELLSKAQADPNTNVRGLVLEILRERMESG